MEKKNSLPNNNLSPIFFDQKEQVFSMEIFPDNEFNDVQNAFRLLGLTYDLVSHPVIKRFSLQILYKFQNLYQKHKSQKNENQLKKYSSATLMTIINDMFTDVFENSFTITIENNVYTYTLNYTSLTLQKVSISNVGKVTESIVEIHTYDLDGNLLHKKINKKDIQDLFR